MLESFIILNHFGEDIAQENKEKNEKKYNCEKYINKNCDNRLKIVLQIHFTFKNNV